MWALFFNTYYDIGGETNLIRVSAVKKNLVASVEGDKIPLLSDGLHDIADIDEHAHYNIVEIEEV